MAWDKDKGTARIMCDSKGTAHYILFQEFEMSCGPASVAMAESHYKLACMVAPEERARELSQKYPQAWTADAGAGADNLSYVLNAEGVKAYGAAHIPNGKLMSYFDAYLSDRTLIICHIEWTTGGHFVVLRKKYSDGTLVFLDPWYGIVEMKKKNFPTYKVPGGVGKLSGWLNITYK